MAAATTLFWHDYETTGADARRDRPLQFAGLRTDEDLNPVGEPRVLYCQPPRDLLPAPAACAITGIGPERACAEGLGEAEFAAAVLEELAVPGTCGVGFNSLRFDDEVTRHLLWRNLHDPYAREWRDGNSRWDVIDTLRLARALRPQGLAWPDHADGTPSFRLEDLARANAIEHDAHDALADVYATIELTRRLRAAQPRLYDFVYGERAWQRIARRLDPAAGEPVLHVSEKFPASRGCIAPVAAVAAHPFKAKSVIVADLDADPAPLLEHDAEAIAAALFTPASERDPGTPAIPLKEVALNRVPVVVPLNTLDAAAAERLALDPARARDHLARLRASTGLADKLRAVYAHPPAAEADADVALYAGFVGDADRARMDAVHRRAPAELAGFDPGFEDARLRELYFRYRARNWPGTLGGDEAERWRELRWQRLCRGAAGSPRALAGFREALAAGRESGLVAARLGAELEAWADTLLADLPACNGNGDA
ncbi:MAG: exodeoxyribonuclease I [Halofilum sp. (in: g-proteobacteria)]|nr:exodeoxyribonuclease I [Halofilum sp. (in: g-proteobacteria)]